jgi:hypothetical protein
MLSNVKRVYALKEFTVEQRARGWFYRPTYGSDTEWKGPYSSEFSIALMIARQLRKEIIKRNSAHKLPE